MDDLKKSLVLEGVASVEEKDSQGEVLKIAGADITPLKSGIGFVNEEHKSGSFSHLVGRVLDAEKIYSRQDCKTPKQVEYWEDLKKPYIWTKFELFDGAGHRSADDIAAIARYADERHIPSPIKISVEGKKLQTNKKTGELEKTLIRGIALTVAPAVKSTRTELVGVMKSRGMDDQAIDSLIKSDPNSIPSFIEVQDHPLEQIRQMLTVVNHLLGRASDIQSKRRK